jgi:hypothetical protein
MVQVLQYHGSQLNLFPSQLKIRLQPISKLKTSSQLPSVAFEVYCVLQ